MDGTDMTEPRVGVIMGSDSDWPVMVAAAEALAEFDVPFEVGVVSAHRTPGLMLDYARGAAGRGLEVIIAGAGGAAHLPGMLASLTPLPVIGVPVPLKNMDGLDSLLSIVQMPNGVPVATVAIGAGRCQAGHHVHPLATQRVGIGQGLLDEAAAELVDPVGQAGQAAFTGVEIARRGVEQRLCQAVGLQPGRQLGGRDGVGEQVFDRVEAIGSRSGEAVEEGVLGVHHRQVGGEAGHGSLRGDGRWADGRAGGRVVAQARPTSAC